MCSWEVRLCNPRSTLPPPWGFRTRLKGFPQTAQNFLNFSPLQAALGACRVQSKHPKTEAGIAGPALSTSKHPPGRLQRGGGMEGGGILALWPGAHSRTHLGRRLPEQRSVIQAAGPVGPGSKVLHFGAASLVPSRSKASPHQLVKSGRPPLTAHAWPGPWRGVGGRREIPTGRLSLRGPRPLRPGPPSSPPAAAAGSERKQTALGRRPARARRPQSLPGLRGEKVCLTRVPRAAGQQGVKLRDRAVPAHHPSSAESSASARSASRPCAPRSPGCARKPDLGVPCRAPARRLLAAPAPVATPSRDPQTPARPRRRAASSPCALRSGTRCQCRKPIGPAQPASRLRAANPTGRGAASAAELYLQRCGSSYPGSGPCGSAILRL